jgi:hypothetical protein
VAARPREQALAGVLLGLHACGVLGCADVEPAAPRRELEARSEPVRGEAPLEETGAQSISLVLLADLRGVLEPCGCGGRPSDGLDRIAGAIAGWRAQARPALLIAAGELFDPSGGREGQAALEQETLIALLAQLRPDAIIASSSVHGQAGAFASLARSSRATLIAPSLPAFDGLSTASSALLRSGSFTVGVVLASAQTEAMAASSIASLRERGAHAVVLASRAPFELPAALLDLADLAIELGSPAEAARRERAALVVDPGDHGESLWKIDLTINGANVSAHAERYPLGADVASDPGVRTLLDQTFARIHALNASAPQASTTDGSSTKGGVAFVGARTCAACHTSEYLWWQQTPHGRAYATLQGRGRALDLDCIACHVTGFGEPLGASLGNLSELTAVGCESCHGPGGRHADHPNGPSERMPKVVAEARCVRCHDAAHSPQFDYPSFRARLIGPGHGAAVRGASPAQTP